MLKTIILFTASNMNRLLKTLTFTTKTVIFAVNKKLSIVDKTEKKNIPNLVIFFFQPIHRAYYSY